ncbi:hypothetical protein A2U01_0082616, partial [Trifolium medium]|nr:hypothetical protein [Trifolium medium]
MNLPELIIAASSNACMKASAAEAPPVVTSPPRQLGSTLKASLQTLSNANRSKRFCKSRIWLFSVAFVRIGMSLIC